MKILKDRSLIAECDECAAKQLLSYGGVAQELDGNKAAIHDLMTGMGWATGVDTPDLCPKCAGNKAFRWGQK